MSAFSPTSFGSKVERLSKMEDLRGSEVLVGEAPVVAAVAAAAAAAARDGLYCCATCTDVMSSRA